jgi:hypothetical protein
MKVSAQKQLEKAISEAVELADLGGQLVPASEIASRLFDEERDLIAEVSRPWVIDRLTRLVYQHRRGRLRRRHPDQLTLPDPVFEGLPRRIFLRDGHRPRLDDATLQQTEDHLRLLRNRQHDDPRVIQFERVVELHRKWSKIEHGIRWGAAMRREAEEQEKS